MYRVTNLHISRQGNIAHINGPRTKGWSSFKRQLWSIRYILILLSREIQWKSKHNLYVCILVILCLLVCICIICVSVLGWPVISSWTCCEGWQGHPPWSCRYSTSMRAWFSETLWLANSMLLYPAWLQSNFRQKLAMTVNNKFISPTKLRNTAQQNNL